MTKANDSSAQRPITATLIRGRYFDYRGRVWNIDDPGRVTLPVDPEEEKYLRAVRVGRVVIDGEVVDYPRFTFSNDPVSSKTRQH